MKIDLHSHTYYSDGQLSPAELVARAQQMQVDVLAITDHDTLNGLAEAHQTCAQLGHPLAIIDGVEISTGWHNFDIHIVGLNVDTDSPSLQAFLAEQETRRADRAGLIAAKLEQCGFVGVLDKARGLAGPGQLTRAHFARVLVNDFGVASMDTAFKKYLGKGKRAAVKAHWPTMAEAIDAIQAAQGQAVLAHPAHYDMTAKWLRRLVAEFATAGGDGIEIAAPAAGQQKSVLINELAAEHQLKASSGSDFHFPSRWRELGKNPTPTTTLTPIWQNWPQAVNNTNKENADL